MCSWAIKRAFDAWKFTVILLSQVATTLRPKYGVFLVDNVYAPYKATLAKYTLSLLMGRELLPEV